MTKKIRCPWATPGDELYELYHDEEWGVVSHDDHRHFEFLVLEAAQAGLSWITILKRREGYKKAYANFNPEIVAQYDNDKIEELLKFEGIIRNRLKITSSIENARYFLTIQKEFGSFDSYIWGLLGRGPLINHWESMSQVPCLTEESKLISKALSKRGFRFIGPKIIYSYMQALGMVNDHLTSCFLHKK